jgi:L-arabinose isomerase
MREAFAQDLPTPKLAVIGGMMAYFESIMEPGFRDDRRGHVAAVTRSLAGEFALCDLGLWAAPEDTAPMAQRLAAKPPDLLLLVPTMATPPAGIAALARQAGVPVVIACAHELSQVTDAYDMRELCRHSTNVGAAMLGAMLRRDPAGATPILVSGFLDDPAFHARLRMALRTAALAVQMRGLRIGRLGAPMPGYDHIGLSAEEAAMGGVEVVDIALPDWQARNDAVTEAEIAAFRHDRLPHLLPRQTDWAPSESLDRAIRQALALDRLAQEAALACGSLCCRGPFGVEMPRGAIGCLATSLMTGSGRPFSATGDLVTAIAMLIGKRLGGATLYCELDAVDRSRDAFLVANTGEGDFGWCPPGSRAAIRPAAAHSGREVPGVVLQHELSAGPATMLGVVPDPQAGSFRLIALEGATPDAPAKTGLKVTNGWFQTALRPATAAFEAWAEAGATHHGALSRGALAEPSRWLARALGYRVAEIAGEGARNG